MEELEDGEIQIEDTADQQAQQQHRQQAAGAFVDLDALDPQPPPAKKRKKNGAQTPAQQQRGQEQNTHQQHRDGLGLQTAQQGLHAALVILEEAAAAPPPPRFVNVYGPNVGCPVLLQMGVPHAACLHAAGRAMMCVSSPPAGICQH